MTTEQWERENQDILMEYFIDGDPSVRRIQCEYCRKVIYTQTRNRKYCSFQTCGHKMLNLRKSLKKRAERGTYTCPCCGEQFLPIRADARYCSNACRQKDYRQRKTAVHTSLWGTWQVCQVPYLCSLLSVKWHFPFWEVPKKRLNCSPPNPQNGNLGWHLKSGYAFRNLICNSRRIKFPLWELDFSRIKIKLSKW